jgi:hypothetical protein
VASGRSGWCLYRVSGALGIPRPPRRPRAAPVGLSGSSGSQALLAPIIQSCAAPTAGLVASRWPFSLPPRPFAVAGRAPEGFPTRQPAPTEIGTDGPHDLGLPFEALLRALPPPLGWAPLMRLASTPSPTSPVRVHSREQAPFGPALPSNRTCSVPVVSHHLDGFLRAQARGFVAPRCQPGVRRVSDPPEPVPSEDGSGPPGALPATRVHTLRRVSLADSRHRITAAPCPRVVTCTVQPSTATEAATTLPVPANREPRGLRRGSLAQAAASSTVKLRSAEADPHVTDARLRLANQLPASSDRRPRATEVVHWLTIESRRAWRPTDPEESGTTPAPESARASRPAAEAADTPRGARTTEVIRADPSRRRERPTTGPCSADESVVSIRRCQRPDTRSFHGLCSPPRSTRTPHQPGVACPSERTRHEVAAPSAPVRLSRPTRAPLGSLRGLPPGAPPKRVARAEPGAEADRERRAFSARRPRPGTAPHPLGAAEAVLESGAVSPESVRRRGREPGIRDAFAAAVTTRRWIPVAAAPRGRSH